MVHLRIIGPAHNRPALLKQDRFHDRSGNPARFKAGGLAMRDSFLKA